MHIIQYLDTYNIIKSVKVLRKRRQIREFVREESVGKETGGEKRKKKSS